MNSMKNFTELFSVKLLCMYNLKVMTMKAFIMNLMDLAARGTFDKFK